MGNNKIIACIIDSSTKGKKTNSPISSKEKSQNKDKKHHTRVNFPILSESLSDMDERYKERVRDFLVNVTSKPIVLGQYIPPVKNIVRNPENSKILSNPQLYINGFKTNRERVKVIIPNNPEGSLRQQNSWSKSNPVNSLASRISAKESKLRDPTRNEVPRAKQFLW